MRAHTTIGVNWWLHHSWVPDLYVFENVSDRHRAKLLERADDYAGTPLLLKQFVTNFSPATHRRRMRQISSLPSEIRSHLYLSSDLLVPGRTADELRIGYRWLRRLGMFRPRQRFQWVAKRTASLTFLVSLCVRAGFERIVLCGVDLNRPGTFYRAPDPQSERTLHETEDPAAKVVPISRVLQLLNEEVLCPRGIRLFVADASSALASWAPVYPWDGPEVPDAGGGRA